MVSLAERVILTLAIKGLSLKVTYLCRELEGQEVRMRRMLRLDKQMIIVHCSVITKRRDVVVIVITIHSIEMMALAVLDQELLASRVCLAASVAAVIMYSEVLLAC